MIYIYNNVLVIRYEALKAGTAQRKCVFDEANSQREQVDSVIEELVPLLEQLETKCQPLLGEEKDKTEPNEILEDAKLADSCQNECAVLAPKLEVLNSAALNWFTTRDQDKVRVAHPPIHLSTHPPIHSSTHPLIFSSTHSSTHLLIHSSTHSSTQSTKHTQHLSLIHI